MNAPAHERTALGLPLATGGATLIEASAGTGKTYALTTLVARLLVEQGMEIGALLVVTFTNAATDELRDRIRHTLRSALRMAAGQPGRQDAQAVELLTHWDGRGIARDDAAGRLEVAIADLDRANVLTIHGFCQRVLTDFAFECGLSFGFEITGDGFDVVRAVVRDHWRRVLYPAPSVRVRRAMEAKFLPEELADWVAGKVAKRDLDIRGAERLDAAARALLEDREEAWRVAFEDTRAA
ncbi:MAG: UvrD-helicase domain-containing protein, partial [Gammaproteobacteria bacterium]|nr:UvrD-helicase domain-containing protein [Gammaproteobacteria bacterium]